MLERCMKMNDLQLLIGDESGYEVLDDYTLIAAPYKVAGKTLGVLGVIGPTRMPYDRMIQIVDITAKMVSNALSHK